MDSEELGRLRREVYGPHPDPESVQRYGELLQVAADSAADQPATAPVSHARQGMRRRRRPALLVAASALLVLAALAVVAVHAWTSATELPTALPAPALAGRTLVAYGNQRAVSAATTGTQYVPFGYTVFQPSGGSLHVALRCAGVGTVVITAGQRFPFRCAGPDRVQHLDDGRAHRAPFVVTGATTGDVVWAVRITERASTGSSERSGSRRFGDAG